MIAALLAALTAAALGVAAPAATENAAVPLLAGPARDAIARAGFTGHVLIARGDTVLVDTDVPCPLGKPQGEPSMACDQLHAPGDATWPWASVTKQVVAILTMQQVEAGRLALDAPASRYLPALGKGAPSPTVRQLLQHRAGLRNPDDTTPDADGMPSFYAQARGQLDWCLARRGAAGGAWSYNNCDYIVLDAVLKRATGQSAAQLFAGRIAAPLGLRTARLLPPGGGTPAPFLQGGGDARVLAGFGAAGALVGTPRELLGVDRALAGGRLLGKDALAELWRGDPSLGYMALGQWAFGAPLKGCAAPGPRSRSRSWRS